MQHSVKGIGENYEALSTMRNEKIKFNAEEFFKFQQELHYLQYNEFCPM